MKNSEATKLFIGPMSINIVNSVCDISKEEDIRIGLIPSRRQIEYNGGYVNNWRTSDFCEYVRGKRGNVLLQRDHGGPLQGRTQDDGRESFKVDCDSGFDLIHVDPWKKYKSIHLAAEQTVRNIKFCISCDQNIKYEIGTEAAIREYSVDEFEKFISLVADGLSSDFEKVVYAVVQGGTAIVGTRNVGEFNLDRFYKMLQICRKYGLLSKEHNGDYLSEKGIRYRFELGLDGLNIAPEFGSYETQCLLQSFQSEKQFSHFFNLCYNSKSWVKWMPSDFVMTNDNRKDIISVCGHYVFSRKEFIDLKNELPDIDLKIQANIKQKLRNILCAIK